MLDMFRSMAKYNNMMRDLMAVTRALADPTRVRILRALRGGELCVCQVVEFCGLAPSTVSKHLSILHQAGLLESRKTERWVYYRLAGARAPVAVRRALGWVQAALVEDPQETVDARKLKAVLKQDPRKLCQRQAQK